jgi:hypothetical protein
MLRPYKRHLLLLKHSLKAFLFFFIKRLIFLVYTSYFLEIFANSGQIKIIFARDYFYLAIIPDSPGKA